MKDRDRALEPTTPAAVGNDVEQAFEESGHPGDEAEDRAREASRHARRSAEAGGPARLDRAGSGEEEEVPRGKSPTDSAE